LILGATGFVANAAQNVDVLNGLKAMMSVIPVAIGVVALIILMFFYKLDEGTMAKVKVELDERRKASEPGAATA
jgi:GPH family glycoside/pentoside/hexuronide:cation symporter